MTRSTGGGLTRRRFLRRLALFVSLASASRYGESLWADEPASDPLGQTLPRRLPGRTEEKVTMLGLGGFHVGSLSEYGAQAMIEASMAGAKRNTGDCGIFALLAVLLGSHPVFQLHPMTQSVIVERNNRKPTPN